MTRTRARRSVGRQVAIGWMAAVMATSGVAQRTNEWWPERAAFRSEGGKHREALSPEGCYVYDAENAAVFFGLGRITPGTDALAPCDEGLRFLPLAGGGGLVGWTLGAITPGSYWLAIQACSGDEGRPHGAESNYAYLFRVNGTVVDLPFMDAPVYVGKGLYAAEFQSEVPVFLKPGDRVTVASPAYLATPFVGKLKLHPRAPPRGPLIRTRMYAPSHVSEGATELWKAGCRAALQTSGAAAVATYWLENRANGSQTVEASFRVTDYYGCPVTNLAVRHDLADCRRVESQFEFPIQGDAPRYRVAMTVTGTDREARTKHAFLGVPVTQGRHTMSALRGPWQMARIPGVIRVGRAPPPDAPWEPYDGGLLRMGVVWGSDAGHLHTHVAWVRTAFTVPAWMSEKRIVLHFGRLANEAVVYVNGTKVGEEFGPGLPCAFDVTAALRAGGTNELLIGLRDWISAIDQKALEAHGPEWTSSPVGLAAAPGIEINMHPTAGIGGAWLENRPEVAVEDVYAIASVRQGTLDLDLTLGNAGRTDRDMVVASAVHEAGRPVLSLPERTVTLKAGTPAVVRLGGPFPHPHLWSVADPHLYELRIVLRDRAGGQVVETHRSRFGFREFAIRDGLFTLNGTPVKFLSNVPKEEGGLIQRVDMPPTWELDQADETGYLYKHNGFVGGPTEYNLASDLYWKNAEEFTRRVVRARRNHPCIAYWSPANEFACFARTTGSADAAGGQAVARRRLYALGQALRSEDPARPIEFDSDDDLGGRWETLSLHYPRDDAPFRPNLYVPDCYLFRPMDKPLQPGAAYDLGFAGVSIPAKYREKPVLASEIGQFSIGIVHDVTLIGGEEPYVSFSAGDRYWQAQLDRYILDGVRDIEASWCHPWEHYFAYGTTKIACPPRYAVALDYMGHWRSGEEVAFQCNIHHDILASEPMTVAWALVDAAGRTAASGVLAERVFQPAELLRAPLRFRAPRAVAATPYRFVLEVRLNGQTVFSRAERFVVYPRRPAAVRLAGRVGLYDPERKSQAALDLLGVRPQTVALAEPEALQGLDALLIGRDALTDETARQAGPALREFVQRGGTVAVFEQARPPRWAAWLPYRVNADLDRTSSFAFPRVADHPILKGIALEDLRLWRGDRVVSRHDYLKPERGNVLSVVDAGGVRGLEWAPLLELRFGEGRYVLSQLCLLEKAAVDPCAAAVLANLLEYCGGKPASRPAQAVRVLAETNSALAGFVAKLATDAAVLPLTGGNSRPELAVRLLVDASTAPPAERAGEIVKVAHGGGTVILHGLQANSVAAWSQALGARLDLRAVPAYYSAMAIRRAWHPLLTGLSMHELHWRQRAGGDGSSFEDWAKLAEIAQTEVVTDAPGARACTYPAVFVSLPCGRGEIIVDQIRWDTAGETVGPFCRRIASTLLANLGAGFEPMPTARSVEKPLVYVPVDLSPFANRPMADDVGYDKEGGWSDQGAHIDGREFPSGRVIVKGVPFLIGGEREQDLHAKTVIVLSISPDHIGRRFRERVTEVKGIPVQRKVETLNFLHTGAWMFPGPVFSYLVNYADGAQEEIRVVSGINITDWSTPSSGELPKFPEEMPGITTQVGLIAANPTFKAIAAYLMEWVNPHPDKVVATVDIVATFRSHTITPIIMGITAGIKPSEAGPGDRGPQGDRAQAEALVKQAEARIAEGQYAAAEAALRDAVAADATCGRAYYLLGRVCRDTTREKEAVRYYRKASGILPESTEILNELGALFEVQGNRLQALTAYQQSLEVNWNQPPVLQAVSRLSGAP